MFCKNCGKEIGDKDKFCDACGWKNDATTQKVSVGAEIKQHKVLFALPILYFVWKYLLMFFSSTILSAFVRPENLENAILECGYITVAFFGLAVGALVYIAIKCSQKFAWICTIPLFADCVGFVAMYFDEKYMLLNVAQMAVEIALMVLASLAIKKLLKNRPLTRLIVSAGAVISATVITFVVPFIVYLVMAAGPTGDGMTFNISIPGTLIGTLSAILCAVLAFDCDENRKKKAESEISA